jgi:hypothetical protein
VATIPLSPFYKNGSDERIIRFCFAKKEETLREAAARLRRYFQFPVIVDLSKWQDGRGLIRSLPFKNANFSIQ